MYPKPYKAVTNVTFRNNPNQQTLWGDTYLTPQEALVYINQMLSTLKRYKEKTQ